LSKLKSQQLWVEPKKIRLKSTVSGKACLHKHRVINGE
jgi:hypothetical protein